MNENFPDKFLNRLAKGNFLQEDCEYEINFFSCLNSNFTVIMHV